MQYKILVDKNAEKALKKIDIETAIRIRDKIRSLAIDPRPDGCIKLYGQKNAYRVRVGDYRIIYEIHDSKVLILVINIGHRKEIYR